MRDDPIIVIPKQPKARNHYRISSVRIKEETIQALDEIAVKTGYSRNELIGIFLEYAIERCEVAD